MRDESKTCLTSNIMTDEGRPLFLSFTLRSDKIRVISSRDMTTREMEVYSDRLKKNAKVQK